MKGLQSEYLIDQMVVENSYGREIKKSLCIPYL
jgi:hypothetical protein